MRPLQLEGALKGKVEGKPSQNGERKRVPQSRSTPRKELGRADSRLPADPKGFGRETALAMGEKGKKGKLLLENAAYGKRTNSLGLIGIGRGPE